MNRLLEFSTGTVMTFLFSHTLGTSDLSSVLLRQLVSLVGGILSTVAIAWLKRRWEDRRPPTRRS